MKSHLKRLSLVFVVTTSPCWQGVIYAPAAFLGSGSRFSGSLSGIEPWFPVTRYDHGRPLSYHLVDRSEIRTARRPLAKTISFELSCFALSPRLPPACLPDRRIRGHPAEFAFGLPDLRRRIAAAPELGGLRPGCSGPRSSPCWLCIFLRGFAAPVVSAVSHPGPPRPAKRSGHGLCWVWTSAALSVARSGPWCMY